jgi:hypothetical protein
LRHKYASWIKEAATQIEALGVPRRRQEDLGWTDFHADPPPATEHLHQFASLAVELCCFDEEGRWGRQEEMLYGIVAATEAVSSTKVPLQDLANLAELAQGGDENMDDIRFWFQVQFPPIP